MSLFPLIDAPDTGTVPAATLPLAREIAWDFVRDQPIWRAGRPVYVTGAGAVLVWAWNCIHTERFRYDVFTTDYGQDLSGLIGQPYGDDIRQSEAIRTIREALMIHPYITAVDQVSARFEGTLLKISISSIYTSEGDLYFVVYSGNGIDDYGIDVYKLLSSKEVQLLFSKEYIDDFAFYTHYAIFSEDCDIFAFDLCTCEELKIAKDTTDGIFRIVGGYLYFEIEDHDEDGDLVDVPYRILLSDPNLTPEKSPSPLPDPKDAL